MVKKENEYDWKITAWKGIKIFVIAAIPAGAIALTEFAHGINVIDPEHGVYIGIIAAGITCIANYMKHK